MYDSLKILSNGRADVLAKQGAGLHPKNMLLYNNITQLKYLAVVNAKYITKCMLKHIELFDQELLDRVPVEGKAKPDVGSLPPDTHLFCRLPNGAHRCVHCFATSATGRLSSKCRRNIIRSGHKIWTLAHVHFCARCGTYSGGRIGLLAQRCPGFPNTTHLARAKPRLLQGIHPSSGDRLGEAAPIFPTFSLPGDVSDPEALLELELT